MSKDPKEERNQPCRDLGQGPWGKGPGAELCLVVFRIAKRSVWLRPQVGRGRAE